MSQQDELEKMLIAAGGSPEMIKEAKEKSHGLGIFIRSLVGLDYEAARQAFSEFINSSTTTPNQIEFVDLVVQELTRNGVMPPGRLFESPFTNLSAQGPLAIFAPAQVTKLIQILETVNARAAA